MLKHYLVASNDDPITRWEPKLVVARSGEEALARYIHEVYAKDEVFRSWVLDLALNFGFAGQFHLGMAEAHRHQDAELAACAVTTEMPAVRNGVRAFFVANPVFADKFLQYIETQDAALIDDELYACIAAIQAKNLVARDLESFGRV